MCAGVGLYRSLSRCCSCAGAYRPPATDAAGITLTDHFAMYPAASVSGYYFSHPRSQYFVVGRVSKEQVADYARRKGVDLQQAERWLASNLDYDPE